MKDSFNPIELFLYAAIISGLFTFIVSPTLVISLFFSVFFFFLFILLYRDKNNVYLFKMILLLYLGLSYGFIVVKLITNHLLRALLPSECILMICLCCELLSISGAIIYFSKKKYKKQNSNSNPGPFTERTFDLKRTKEYILNSNILGINADWGMGKSFLIEQLIKDTDIQQKFDVIQIDLLSCDLDKIELVLIEEIDRIFKKHHIYTNNSRRLKNALGNNKWLNLLGVLGFETKDSMAASFDGYKKEFDKLPKKILLIFEDIDRIENKDTIKKIFAICEKLSCEQLHIIYQYYNDELEKIGFTRHFLEKYIHYTINLTPISYESLVTYLWDKLKMSETIKDRNKVGNLLRIVPGVYNINQMLNININVDIKLPELSIRKMQTFLSELKIMITENDEFQKDDVIDTVIRVIFIKHFFTEYYNAFEIFESPLDAPFFFWEDEYYNIKRIIKKICKSSETDKPLNTTFEEFLNQKDNRTIFGLLLFLGYSLEDAEIGNNKKKNYNELEEHNNKIDHILSNIIASGSSEYTDAENAVNKLFSEVIYISEKIRDEAWTKYQNDMFSQNLFKDNKTIFKMGINPFNTLFKCLKLCNIDEKKWIDFLDFYFNKYISEECNFISDKLIINLNYCETNNKNILFHVIYFISQLDVKYNYNGNDAYTLFLKNYMGSIASLGYSQNMEYWKFDFTPDFITSDLDFVINTLENLIKELQNKKPNYISQYIQNDFDKCIKFVEKNIELLKCKDAAQFHNPYAGTITEIKSKWIHQAEVDRILNLQKQEILAAADNSYELGEIYLPEYDYIIEKLNSL